MIIESDNYAAAGIETLFFPGGEPHAKIPPELKGDILLVLKLRTWNDTGLGACVLDALWRNRKVDRLKVFTPYFPGARQDRSDGLSPYTLELMKDLFSLYVTPTHVFDPHSEVLTASRSLLHWYMPSDLVYTPVEDVVGIIAPDEGALERAEDFRAHFYPNAILVCCNKKRDPTTGRLSGYHMPDLVKFGRYIIVDDICDGGGTFNLLADALRPSSALCQLELFVSHGIFSKGLDAIDPLIERITTTDSWCQLQSTERLRVLPLATLYPRIIGE